MIRTSAVWRRLALDIRLHNQTMVAHPYKKTMGLGEVGLWMAGIVGGWCC